MALILIRGESHKKVENSLKLIQKEANLKLITLPKIIDHFYADALVESILNSKLRNKSKFAIAFFVRGSTSYSISKIKKIHTPAHVTVVSNDYGAFSKLEYLMNNAEIYHIDAHISNTGMIDYSLDKKERGLIRNERLNSYIK